MPSSISSDRLDALLAEREQPPLSWQEPPIFDASVPDDYKRMSQLLEDENVEVQSGAEAIARDLADMHYPAAGPSDTRWSDEYQQRVALGKESGRWVYFPWRRVLRQVPSPEDFLPVRSYRDRELVTVDEQQRQYHGVGVAVIGLSVGANVAESLVTSGVGDELILMDYDTVDHMSLNRVPSTVLDVGSTKVHNIARLISEKNPYVKQIHFPEGATVQTLSAMLARKPKVLVEAVDNLRMKVVIREAARLAGVPVVMGTDAGSEAPVDVTRYDIDPNAQHFNGNLTDDELGLLLEGQATRRQMGEFVIKIVGTNYITPRIATSLQAIGVTLGGFPQRGTTARRAGSAVSDVVQQIVLGAHVPSGRYEVPGVRFE